MTFNSTLFGVFLAVVFSLYWLLGGKRNARYSLLLGASIFFYGYWKASYLLLIAFSTLIDWFVGNALHKLDRADPTLRRRRRLLLLCSLVSNLGLLGVFKYYDFFRASIEAAFGVSGPVLDLVLPVGISFYTFQALSYTIDIYRGQLAPARNLLEFALFITFFPQLVAGPIVRAADFLPQFDREPELDQERLMRGLFRIMEGLIKKVVIADVIGVHLVDGVFAPGSADSGLRVLLGIYGYALQIYGDFAGYSDIAIGSALLFGFRLNENFLAPYKAVSIQDFWHRWHISLSTWLRDYLYVPLGGNRKGPLRTYVNLALVMLLGGLWHGANWTFVFWGALHGLWLGINRWWQRRGWHGLPGAWGKVVSVLITFHLVCFAWVFFRSKTFGDAASVLQRLCSSSPGKSWFELGPLPLSAWFALAIGYGSHFLPVVVKARLAELWCLVHPAAIGALFAVFFGLLAYVEVEAQPFIYFQF
jgi:D-alanyl-lipoteichoic acid acyltransferase DltB (MBOAT superfamily)